MEYFLQHIAKSLNREFGENLNTHCLVFPGRRAGLFFMKYLAAEQKRPVWAPSILTIKELFRSFSDLQPAENETLLFELYRVYRTVTKTGETFDDFYFWGDMLLSDFNDVDKYLADASRLFTNVSDIKKIDQQFGGMTPEQAEIVKQFWTNFDPLKQTDEKAKFQGIWSHLYEIYSQFRISLRKKNMAYEGMIFRDVIENRLWEREKGKKYEMVHIIGFNALNECENELMKALKGQGRAKFYWDYDNSYMNPGKLNSAGFFLRDNIRTFGNDMPEGWNYNTLLSEEKVVNRAIDASSDIAQVKLIPGLISQIPGMKPGNAHETAVILADEELLVPVLSSLPENSGDFNITMGYPFKQTQVYLLIRQLVEMQDFIKGSGDEYFYPSIFVSGILRNNLLAGLIKDSGEKIISDITSKNLIMIPSSMFQEDPVLKEIFRKPLTIKDISDYLIWVLSVVATSPASEEDIRGSLSPGIRNEFIYRAVLSINRLCAVLVNDDIPFTIKTWSKLLDRILRSQSVPFSGEPLSGIQIMGILETRALDFKNIIILSVNEGVLPSLTGASSFIPFTLREAFRLPSINHQESVYAYHFYRLLHRAENVTFVYNSNPEGLRSGEMSRFLQQMKFEPHQAPLFTRVSYEIKNPVGISETVERSREHNLKLLQRFSYDKGKRQLSPLAINTWLSCRMRFYYRYIQGIKEKDEISEEIDPAMLGILLHDSIRNLYGRYVGKTLNEADIRSVMMDSRLQTDVISSAVMEKFRKGNKSLVAVNEMIVVDVLRVFISRILETDLKYVPFTIKGLEQPISFPFKVKSEDTDIKIVLGGTIDRVDEKEGKIRIIDYKTGSTLESLTGIELLFEDDRVKGYDGWLQTMIYCEGYLKEKSDNAVVPMIYQVKKKVADENDERLLIRTSRKESAYLDDYRDVRDTFTAGLADLLSIIFNEDEPFEMTSEKRNKCAYCPYRVLCLR